MPDKIKCPRGGVGGMDTLGFTEAQKLKIAHYKLEDKLKFIFI